MYMLVDVGLDERFCDIDDGFISSVNDLEKGIVVGQWEFRLVIYHFIEV